jgi:hypothetical protein
MAKKKRGRLRRTRVIKLEPAPSQENDDLIVARKIANINAFIATLAVAPVLYPILDMLGPKHLLQGNGVYVLLACALINPVLMFVAIRINRYSKGIFNEHWPAVENAAKYRKLGVWQITIALLIDIIACIPFLYSEGYLVSWAKQVPGTDVIGENISFAVLFIGAAIAAGILGNFVYDILKYILKRLVGKESRD